MGYPICSRKYCGESSWLTHFSPEAQVQLQEKSYTPIYTAKGSMRRQKYLADLVVRGCGRWVVCCFSFGADMQNVTGSYGGNLFESPLVFPLNFLLAPAIFTHPPSLVSSRQKWLMHTIGLGREKLILPFRLK